MLFFCGSGFPAAMIEAESLPLSNTKYMLADEVALRAMACLQAS
jgi:hypothetical protein